MYSSSSPIGQTLVGQSGREYVRTRMLRFDATKYQRSVHLAEYVLGPRQRTIFELTCDGNLDVKARHLS